MLSVLSPPQKIAYIEDSPRFPHRGMLIDTGRHYLPVPFVRRVVRSLRIHKLNVLHWHLSDLQSFPFQSKVFPELSRAGSFSKRERYTTYELESVVKFARRNGVRVSSSNFRVITKI